MEKTKKEEEKHKIRNGLNVIKYKCDNVARQLFSPIQITTIENNKSLMRFQPGEMDDFDSLSKLN